MNLPVQPQVCVFTVELPVTLIAIPGCTSRSHPRGLYPEPVAISVTSIYLNGFPALLSIACATTHSLEDGCC